MNFKIFFMGLCKNSVQSYIDRYVFWIRRGKNEQLSSFILRIQNKIPTDVRLSWFFSRAHENMYLWIIFCIFVGPRVGITWSSWKEGWKWRGDVAPLIKESQMQGKKKRKKNKKRKLLVVMVLYLSLFVTCVSGCPFGECSSRGSIGLWSCSFLPHIRPLGRSRHWCCLDRAIWSRRSNFEVSKCPNNTPCCGGHWTFL